MDAVIYCNSVVSQTKWYKGKHSIDSSGSSNTVRYLKKGIVIRNIKIGDSGEYKCIGRTPDKRAFSRTSLLSVVGESNNHFLTGLES